MKQELVNLVNQMSAGDLYTAMFIDPVTGTLNRTAFDKCSPYEVIAIIDLDSLKYVNDNAGHREGDKYLRYLGETLSTRLGQDNVYRLSGDEFVVTGDSIEDLEIVLKELQAQHKIFSFGVQANLIRADEQLMADKKEREHNYLRMPRGVKPLWFGTVL